MIDKKENARPTVGAAGQAAEKDAASKIPQDDYMCGDTLQSEQTTQYNQRNKLWRI